MRRQDISTRCIDNHETIMAMNGKERATPALFINGRPVGDVQTMDFAGDDSEATSMAYVDGGRICNDEAVGL